MPADQVATNSEQVESAENIEDEEELYLSLAE